MGGGNDGRWEVRAAFLLVLYECHGLFEENGKKIHNFYPCYISISRVSTNFHYVRTTIKEKKWGNCHDDKSG